MNESKARAVIIKAVETLPDLTQARVRWLVREYAHDSYGYFYWQPYEVLVAGVKASIHVFKDEGHVALDWASVLHDALVESRKALNEPVVERKDRSRWNKDWDAYCRGHKKKALKKKRVHLPGWDTYNYERCSKCWKDQSKRSHQYYR